MISTRWSVPFRDGVGTRRAVVATILAVAALAGCSSSTGPGGGSGPFAADIDGQSWATDAAGLIVQAGSAQVPGSITIAGTHLTSATHYTALVLTLGFIGATGTYPLGVNPVSTAGGLGQIEEVNGSSVQNRSTNFTGAAGTVTITTLTGSRIAGTFSFTASPILGSNFTGDRVISNGSFDVALPAGFTAVPAANHGSSVSATLGGTAWNGATVVALGGAGSLGLTASSDTYILSLTSAVPITTGTYNMDNTGFIVIATLSGTGTSYGGAGNVGTVTITSFGGGRAAGTFSGTLAGQGGNLTVTGGTFDVRVDTTP
jgi:hypothetical protein